MNILQIAFTLPVAILAITLHEYAHAWAAKREGDDTAEQLGRLTINPIAHIDPMGTIVVPMAMFYMTGFIFGWAKPVPVNPTRYRELVGGDIRVSLAGIVVNFFLAALCTVLVILCVRARGMIGTGPTAETVFLAQQALEFGILLNLVLAVFNLMPIPPLDGSHVAKYLLPPGLRNRYESMGQFGFFLIIILFMWGPAGRVVFAPVWALQDFAYQLIGLFG